MTTTSINALGRSAATRPTGPSMEVILNSLKKAYLTANDPGNNNLFLFCATTINQRKANFTNTRLAIYINTDVQDECIICQDVYGTSLEIFYLPCHHKFHGDCISQWLNMNASCPIW